MAGIDGKLIGMRIGNDFVPCELSCTIAFEVEKLNRSSSENGDWAYHRNGYKSWTASVDGKLLVSSLGSSFNSLFAAYKSGTELTLAIQNRNLDGQPFVLIGQATVRQGQLEAGNTGKARWQMQFTGQGELSDDSELFFHIVNSMPADEDKPLVIDSSGS